MNYLPELDIFGNIVEVKPKENNREIHKHNKRERKRKIRESKINFLGNGEVCKKCGEVMQRRSHKEIPTKFHYIKWDVCVCGHIQHYEEFKSEDWKEYERQNDFIRNL